MWKKSPKPIIQYHKSGNNSGSSSVTVQDLWTMDKLQGVLVGYNYERNVCIKSIYKTLREEGKRAGGVGNIGELYRDPAAQIANRDN